MKSLTILTIFFSFSAFACLENLESKFASQFPHSKVTVESVINVDHFLVDTCNEEIAINPNEKDENRLACNLLKAQRPEGLEWYSVRLETITKETATDLKKLIGTTEKCNVIYAKNIFHTFDQAHNN